MVYLLDHDIQYMYVVVELECRRWLNLHLPRFPSVKIKHLTPVSLWFPLIWTSTTGTIPRVNPHPSRKSGEDLSINIIFLPFFNYVSLFCLCSMSSVHQYWGSERDIELSEVSINGVILTGCM